jgi:hypothetical protein
MKKIIIFAAAVIVAIAFCSCKSQPVEPDIIGSGTVQYAQKSDTYYVVIDSTSYPVESVMVPKQKPETNDRYDEIDPIEGMNVTIFTSKNYKGLHVMYGSNQTSEQIETLYLKDLTGKAIGGIFMVILLLIWGICEIKTM